MKAHCVDSSRVNSAAADAVVCRCNAEVCESYEAREDYQEAKQLCDHIRQTPERDRPLSMQDFMRIFILFETELRRANTQSMLKAIEARYEQLINAAKQIKDEAADRFYATCVGAGTRIAAGGLEALLAGTAAGYSGKARCATHQADKSRVEARKLEIEASSALDQNAGNQLRVEARKLRDDASNQRGEAHTATEKADRANVGVIFFKSSGGGAADISQSYLNTKAEDERSAHGFYTAEAAKSEALQTSTSQADQSIQQGLGSAIQTADDVMRSEREMARAAANFS